MNRGWWPARGPTRFCSRRLTLSDPRGLWLQRWRPQSLDCRGREQQGGGSQHAASCVSSSGHGRGPDQVWNRGAGRAHSASPTLNAEVSRPRVGASLVPGDWPAGASLHQAGYGAQGFGDPDIVPRAPVGSGGRSRTVCSRCAQARRSEPPEFPMRALARWPGEALQSGCGG